MSKIEINGLYLIFGHEKQKAFTLLKEGKDKSEILKATGCTIAVRNVSLSIEEGEIFVIMGLSGSGKSTLLRCVNRLIRPTFGEVILSGLKKEGPEVLLRKMREKNLTVLPVVDLENTLVGEVHLNDLLRLRMEQVRSIESVVRHEVHSVLSDTVVEDILPLMTQTNSPIWVVDERREFLGVVPLSSLIIEVTGKDKKEINKIIQNAIEL